MMTRKGLVNAPMLLVHLDEERCLIFSVGHQHSSLEKTSDSRPARYEQVAVGLQAVLRMPDAS